MKYKQTPVPAPLTRATLRALRSGDEAAVADLLLLESWVIHKPMHLGVMLRVRQICQANPTLASEVAAELAERRADPARPVRPAEECH
jgi:uncharacterized protein (DUF58 family)